MDDMGYYYSYFHVNVFAFLSWIVNFFPCQIYSILCDKKCKKVIPAWAAAFWQGKTYPFTTELGQVGIGDIIVRELLDKEDWMFS